MKIPYLDLGSLNRPHQKEIEKAALSVIQSGYYLYSSDVSDFESEWAAHNQAAHSIGTANGLDALTAILVAMKHLYRWNDGDEVIVSAHTFIASFEAITRARLKPVPCDVDEHTYLIAPSLIEPLITPRTVALMPVHLYGRLCDMDEIKNIAQKHSLRIIVDACQAHEICKGADFGDAAAFSFYPGKNLGALGDGGCLVTNDASIAQFARTFCNYGANIKYHHLIKGINSRLGSIQAAILRIKLQYLAQDTKQRQDMAQYYNKNIHNRFILLPYGASKAHKSNWHIYPIFCQYRQQLQRHLSDAGIGYIVHYPTPPHKQQAYSELNTLTLPVTERLCQTELSIPLNPTLTKEQQDYIVNTLNAFKP